MTDVRSDVVVQGASVESEFVEAISAIAEPDAIEMVPAREGATVVAWRLRAVRDIHGLAEACTAAGLDFAIVPPERRLADLRVLAMDMDSTLITIECIDEIADYAGVKAEVAAVTARAMRGELDFAASLAMRVALFRGLPASVLDAVYRERIELTPGAGVLLAAARASGVGTLLVSGGFTCFTDRLRERLGLDEAVANVLEVVDGKLTGRVLDPVVDAGRKAVALAAMRARCARDGGLVAAIGDGANDLPMLRAADVSIAYRAKPVVRDQASHAIDHGGLDAVLNLFT